MTSSPLQSTYKAILLQKNKELQERYLAGDDISALLLSLSQTIDQLLQEMWSHTNINGTLDASLVAVGGYGREEMHPASDVDLLLLLATEPHKENQDTLSDFVTQLWDLGLDIGHSVRTLEECVEEAKNDLTVITNLIEARYLCGNKALFEKLQTSITKDKIWSSAEFFEAKLEEQKKRYKRFGDTAYRVEPNLKDGPGGLRDIQTIGWIFLREFGVRSLKTLSTSKEVTLLSLDEYHDLIESRDFLWKVRFVLHQLTGRKTDRLLFDHQRPLAHSFGYTNDENNASIETFMQCYYRHITKLERLNEILLGLLREHIFDKQQTVTPINAFYTNYNGYLGLEEPDLFERHPHTLLEVFHIMQITPDIKGLTPKTLRNIRQHLAMIDDDFRANEHNKQIFIAIMSESQGITFALRRMNRYGVLAAYIPAFSHIVGRMQYDLFHAYTVDDHTLNVVRNIRRLSTEKGKEELPFCARIFNTLPKPMVLYLAGLFHDIAKGRGGDHSQKGAVDALEFCLAHDLNRHDAETVSWLVSQHLLLSSVAQRQDLSDPDVIKAVAETVVTPERMDYLYLLTICDIRGTNPTLLNTWKHSLLKDLFRATKRYLQTGSPETEDSKQLIETKKKSVVQLLLKQGVQTSICDTFFSRFNKEYVLQHSIETLAWHLKEICQASSTKSDNNTVTRIRESNRKDSALLFIYTKDRKDVFIKIMSAIEKLQLNVVAARIFSSHDGYILDTFNLLTADGEAFTHPHDQAQLLALIEKNLGDANFSYSFNHLRMPRQLKHFETPTRIFFAENQMHKQTIITIRTGDQAGLLTRIGKVFSEQGIMIHGAKIATLGEIAEDIFYITRKDGDLIQHQEEKEKLAQALENELGEKK